MTIRNLDRLLAPRSVALVGASERPGSIGRIVAENLARGGFAGPIRLVNPKRREIAGRPCFPTIASLPEAPDLAVIATPPATIPAIIKDLGAKGCRAAVVITAGVPAPIRQAMLDAARPHLLRIQGPNCVGLMLPSIGLDASFAQGLPPAGDVALVSQSGAIVTALVDWVGARGIGLSHVVSLGDMADVDFGDMLDYLAGDVASRAILIYMEQLTAAPKFMSAARRAARSKPVIILKSGRHAAGQRAAMSHTGALAGSDAAYDAAFRRAGVVRVRELDDLFEAAEILSRTSRLGGERLMVMTNGGGAGVLAADRLADLDGTLADLAPETVRALNAVLPAAWSKANPIDLIGDADGERYARTLEIVMDANAADAVLIVNCPTALSSGADIARRVIDVVAKRRAAGHAEPAVLTSWLGAKSATAARGLFTESRIPTFETPASAIEGFMHLVRYARSQDALMRTPPLMDEAAPDHAAACAIIETARAEGRALLTEIEAKALLAAYAIPVTPTRLATDPAAVEAAATELLAQAPACVVKIVSADIPHKSDIGGVRLGITSPAEAKMEAAAMLERVGRSRPGAKIAGFAVQPMIRRARAHELLVGASEDTTLGPMLMFGAGGTAVEALKDTVQALPPLDMNLARDMIRETRIHRLLAGYRDRPAADVTAIAGVLVKLGTLVLSHPELREIEINPLLADEAGVIGLDARARITLAHEPARTVPAIRPYPERWRTGLTLKCGRRIDIRPIRPEDEHRYDRFLARISPHDMRMRFFAAAPNMSHRFIARLTQIDYAREMAFVAIEGEGAEAGIVGVARMIADPDYRRAEFAILIATDRQRTGLGSGLMRHLQAYAKAEGLAELHGEVLAENDAMLAMCRGLGFTIGAVPDDATIKRAVLAL